MPNLYLFRNVITSKVLVSPTFKMESAILSQIREHRPELKIRPDHWTPFAVLTDLRKHQTAEMIQKRILDLTAPYAGMKGPAGRYRLPLPGHDSTQGWRIPEEVRSKTIALCKVLNSPEFTALEGTKKEEAAAVEKPESTTDAPADLVEEEEFLDHTYRIWWERDEYRHVVDEQQLLWPDVVAHERLRLLRNRFPLVPGLNLRKLGLTR
ncbi:hypothetical protein HK102_002613 [Quaeritorhiza haematococci]|nr:hypothetical protein HK102_002613 [Quaeritorhiza haematococci]